MRCRTTLALSLATLVVFPLALCGCAGPAASTGSAEDPAALASLSAEERLFVGRWVVNMDRLAEQIKAKGKTNDAAMAIAIAETFFFDIGADRSLLWTGGPAPHGWTVKSGRLVVEQATGNGGPEAVLALIHRGDTLCIEGGGGEPPIELTRTSTGTPLDPAAVAGTWTLDIDASVKSSLDEFKHTAAIIEKISGKSLGENAPTEQHARASLRSVAAQGGGTITFVPGASPTEGSVQMGANDRGFPKTYQVYKDLLLIRIPSGGPDKVMLVPVTIEGGALLWKSSGSAMVYRKK